tara:strand:+ start:157 stop:309 length:153 start_codon:yes stop_codon:yes gene_type:complete
MTKQAIFEEYVAESVKIERGEQVATYAYNNPDAKLTDQQVDDLEYYLRRC